MPFSCEASDRNSLLLSSSRGPSGFGTSGVTDSDNAAGALALGMALKQGTGSICSGVGMATTTLSPSRSSTERLANSALVEPCNVFDLAPTPGFAGRFLGRPAAIQPASDDVQWPPGAASRRASGREGGSGLARETARDKHSLGSQPRCRNNRRTHNYL